MKSLFINFKPLPNLLQSKNIITKLALVALAASNPILVGFVA